MKKVIFPAILAFFLCMGLACAALAREGAAGEGQSTLPVTVYVGGRITLPHLALPGTWVSDKPQIASVSAGGLLVGKKEGKAQIRFQDLLGGARQIRVQVAAKPKRPLKSLKLGAVRLAAGEVKALKPSAKPAASREKLNWHVEDVRIACVDAKGRIAGVAPGQTALTLFSPGGVQVKSRITVYPKVVDFAISNAPGRVKVGGLVQMEVRMEGGDPSLIRWKSSNPAALPVSQKGVVTAKKAGGGKITASAGGKSVSVSVQAVSAKSSLSLSPAALVMGVGQAQSLKVTASPAFVKTDLLYTSDNPQVVSVSPQGKLTARAPGRARIQVQSRFYGQQKVCEVTVADGQIANAAYTWWTAPNVLFGEQGQLFMGYTDDKGGLIAASWRPGRSPVKTRLANAGGMDDHHGVSLTRLEDGRILAIYFSNLGDKMHYRISKAPDSVAAWEGEKTLSCVVAPQKGKKGQQRETYAQVVRAGGKLWLFSRADRRMWVVRTSGDEGRTWTAPKVWLNFYSTAYVRAVAEGDTIHLVAYPNPKNNTTHALHHLAINAQSGAFMGKNGKEIGRLDKFSDKASSALQGKALPVLYTAPSSDSIRMYDVSASGGMLSISFSQWKASAPHKQSQYQVLRALPEGSIRLEKVTQSGRVIGSAGSDYFAGAMFMPGDPNTLFVAREEKGMWQVERWRALNGGWRNEKTLIKSAQKLFRPVLAQGERPLMACIEGRYDKYSSFSTRVNLLYLK